MEKEGLASPVVDCMHNFIKDSSLIWIEGVLIVCCQLCLLHHIKSPLLCNEMVSEVGIPILSDLRHVWPILLKRFSRCEKELVDQVETIVLDIFISGIDVQVSVLELMLQVITDVRPVSVPQLDWIRGSTIAKDGGK
jgi:hypothetical protein